MTWDTVPHISGLEDLEGQAIAVQRNSPHHSYLLSHDMLNLSLYDSVEAALAEVTTGSEKAFLGNLATTNYLIRSGGLTNLRLVAFEAEKPQALHFAVRNDWPQLVSTLNKTIEAISEQEKSQINEKWIDLDTQLDYEPIIRLVLGIASFFAVVLAVSLFWISRLRKEIGQREKVQLALEKPKQETDEPNEESKKISMVDGLTRISNRRYFDDFLQKLWGINMREKFPIVLIMIDIDKFKVYNDTYGHLAGDQCLKTVANLIDRTVKRQGDFVARFGGEEFAMLLSNSTEDGAAKLAERIRKRVEEGPIDYGEGAASVTVSLGVVAMMTAAGVGPNDLIKAADSVLYRGKARGRNQVVRAGILS